MMGGLLAALIASWGLLQVLGGNDSCLWHKGETNARLAAARKGSSVPFHNILNVLQRGTTPEIVVPFSMAFHPLWAFSLSLAFSTGHTTVWELLVSSGLQGLRRVYSLLDK